MQPIPETKDDRMAATATARWNGSLDDGTNPEELIGAAHAGCFSMFLSALLSKAGTPPTSIETTAKVSLDMSGDAPRISRIALSCVGEVDGISADDFQSTAEDAKGDCPVSAALASVPEITLEARLRS